MGKDRIGDPISINTPPDAPGIIEFNSAKPIVELRKEKTDPEFPGFTNFKVSLDEVPGLYGSWAEVLRHARGVYLLVRRATGEQYVGSACGESGFYSRWCSYADGHGGNVAMKELKSPASEFDVSILEVAGSAVTSEDIIAREGLWKEKLGTRVKELKGLNRN